jgi:extracellular elastinolytic metalloproteinase
MLLKTVVLAAACVLAAAIAGGAAAAPGAGDARVYAAGTGKALTAPSNAAPAAIVARFLRSHGLSRETVGTLHTTASFSGANGITHMRMEQRVAGLHVLDAYVKAALNDRGQLVHLIEDVAAVRGAVAPARVGGAAALRAALRRVHPSFRSQPVEVGRQGDTEIYAKGSFFYDNPRVERVAVRTAVGSLEAGYLVETWSERGNLLHETLVGADGGVLAVELRTHTDRYNIFPEHPGATPQTIVHGPGPGNAQSPIGWLFGSGQTTINIAGNNAHAYLDTDANNAPDAGGTAVMGGNFVSAADLTVSPSTATNRNVAVQNLFYFNNVIHDKLFSHGFTEAVGNFQENNFGGGGRGSDSVDAEAQDGAGTDNANFATPRDGRNPRMQMFLWTGKGSHQVVVNSPSPATYPAQGADFGPALTTTGVTGDVVLANDGTETVSDACQAITINMSGKIALIDRGACTFVVKVKNAQNAGAAGAIIANNAGDSIFTMAGDDPTITIPSVFIGQTHGAELRSLSNPNATIRKTDPPPLMRDGDLDSDIIWHEYGHGLTWRMIGQMSGAMSGAIGEGMSDVLAILINGDDVVAEYSFSDPIGIRSAPYTNYPRTYGDVAGTGVHFDGEVYAAIGWRLRENFLAQGLTTDLLLDYLVDGMNFTPAGPTFEEMRDGILQAAAAAHDCLVWDGFADYGVGVGARGRVRGSTVVVTESFTLPAGCSPIP